MNPTWWVTFLLGSACGAVIVGTWLRAMQNDRLTAAYFRGVRDSRNGIAPRLPVDHPQHRRSDRALTDAQAAFGGLLCAAVVLWLAGGVW